jgi:hypothetical protein
MDEDLQFRQDVLNTRNTLAPFLDHAMRTAATEHEYHRYLLGRIPAYGSQVTLAEAMRMAAQNGLVTPEMQEAYDNTIAWLKVLSQAIDTAKESHRD